MILVTFWHAANKLLKLRFLIQEHILFHFVLLFYSWLNRVLAATYNGVVLYAHTSSAPSTLCILHEGLTVQSSHSSPFMLTLTGPPCPLADLFHWQCFIIKATLVLETYIKHSIFVFLLLLLLLPSLTLPSCLSSSSILCLLIVVQCAVCWMMGHNDVHSLGTKHKCNHR